MIGPNTDLDGEDEEKESQLYGTREDFRKAKDLDVVVTIAGIVLIACLALILYQAFF